MGMLLYKKKKYNSGNIYYKIYAQKKEKKEGK